MIAPMGMAMIYRHKNAAIAGTLVNTFQRLSTRCEFRLWALDRVHPILEKYTNGVGRGDKFDLLNDLLKGSDWEYTYISDDDVVVEYRELENFAAVVQRNRLDLAQPAHSYASHNEYPFLYSRTTRPGRRTTFVEIGPLFVVGPTRRAEFIPFPSGFGMGWGLELRWFESAVKGARLAVVDSSLMTHLAAPGTGESYDTKAEAMRLRKELRDHGFEETASDLEDIQNVLTYLE